MRSNSYRGDPYWLTVKYTGTCRKCGKPITRGSKAFYYPNVKALFCDRTDCGQAESAGFDAAVFDEGVYNYNGYL